jgi:thiaminase
MAPPAPPKPTPSLANHLLNRDPEAVNSATQQAFLSHAGCSTISAHALTQWLAQDAHVSRAFVSFVGRLIGKMRLPDTAITMENTTFRTFDLLISTLNNVRREMSFFDTTASKWGLQVESEIPKPATKGFIDLLSSASSSSASLLEGLVLLWATEHVSLNPGYVRLVFATDACNSATVPRGIMPAHLPTTAHQAQITRYPRT